jgi:hypothetical protein
MIVTAAHSGESIHTGSSIAYQLDLRQQPHRRPAWGVEQPGEQRCGEDGTDRRPVRAYLPRLGYCGRGWLHPHVHCVIPAGGLSPDKSRWIRSPTSFFVPVRVLSKLFRGEFVGGLKRLFRSHKLSFHGSLSSLTDSKQFRRFLRQLFRKDWVVYAKKPFRGPAYVLQYLARYTHRVAISNQRLISFEEGKVTSA